MTCWLCGSESNVEERMCKKGPCRICVEVKQINKAINQKIATLQRLIARRHALRSEQNRAHDPMHRLPVELKDYIFQLVLPSHEWGESATVMPSYLASVCREWRDIALANPFLWSAMNIPLGESTSNPSNFVHDWILRSRTLPLTFHLEVVDSSERGLARSRKAFVEIMSQYSNRLQSLSLDAPFAGLGKFQNDFQWYRLTQLRIIQFQQLSIFNTTASPERVEFLDFSFKSLQISWNRLSNAKFKWINLNDIALVFQHASQMTHCHIVCLVNYESFSMPSITHHRLKKLTLYQSRGDASSAFLGSLTLPCLQELNTTEMALLANLPALVHRSSCPLKRLTLCLDSKAHLEDLDLLQPLLGVADLWVDHIEGECEIAVMKKLLLEEYLPDLCQITLRLQPFLLLWEMGIISPYLDRKRPRSEPSEERPRKCLVIEPGQALEFQNLWNSDVGEELKELGITLREDGFEFL